MKKRLQPKELYDSSPDIFKGLNLEPVILSDKRLTFDPDKPILLLPLGTVNNDKGVFFVDEESVNLILSFFTEKAIDLVIDYEHQTLTGQEAPAAGWVVEMFKQDDGIYGKVEWNEKAKDYIEKKEYKYHSPVVFLRKHDRKAVVIHSLGLTNSPAIHGMAAIANKFDLLINSTEVPLMNELIERLVYFLNMPLTSTKDEIVTELKTLITQLEASDNGDAQANKNAIALANKILELEQTIQDDPTGMVPLKDIATELGLKGDVDFSTVKGTIMALKNPTGYVTVDQFKALETQLADKNAQELVEIAMKEGKVTPAQKDWAIGEAKKDLEAFTVFLKYQPEVVPVSERPGYTPPSEPRTVTDETQVSINKSLGISEEEFKTYGPKAKEV